MFIRVLRSGLIAAVLGAETFPARQVKVVGPVEYGQPTEQTRYTGTPKYQAFEFNARPGDRVEVSIKSKTGKLRSFLTDANYQSLAGGAGHFQATIPAGSQPATYYILVTAESGRAVAYTLELQRPER